MYIKYIYDVDDTSGELTNGKVYKVNKITKYGGLTLIRIENDKGNLSSYLLRDDIDFIDVTKETKRNKTIDEIILD